MPKKIYKSLTVQEKNISQKPKIHREIISAKQVLGHEGMFY
jgi:hypothetical protein